MQTDALATLIYTILPEKCYCRSSLDLKKLLWQGHVVAEDSGCGLNCNVASLPPRL